MLKDICEDLGYTFIQELEHGSNGFVCEALDRFRHTRVIVKTCHTVADATSQWKWILATQKSPFTPKLRGLSGRTLVYDKIEGLTLVEFAKTDSKHLFASVAVNAMKSLFDVASLGLMHGDVNARNFIVNPVTAEVSIIDPCDEDAADDWRGMVRAFYNIGWLSYRNATKFYPQDYVNADAFKSVNSPRLDASIADLLPALRSASHAARHAVCGWQ